MNKTILVGNITADPKSGKTEKGISYCNFKVAVNRTFASADGEKEADFFEVVAWRGIADNCTKYLKKGNKVAVDGRLQSGSYEDKDGVKRKSISVVADEVEFLSPKME